MRLWSIHPKYLDRRGLVACWREALLAQAVLAGKTIGYRNHPQLQRFDLTMIGAYLYEIYLHALVRGYNFDVTKIERPKMVKGCIVTAGQLAFECDHLRKKVMLRAPDEFYRLPRAQDKILAHPVLKVVAGPVCAWEKGLKTQN